MQRSVSVVIPNYNGKQLLAENLPSLLAAMQHINAPYEIIISDDASADDSLTFLHKNYPQIKTIRTDINMGFSHTANRGISTTKMELVFLLNSDVKLKEDYFSSQWKYFDDPDTFGVMGSIWSEDGKRLMDAAKYPIWKGGQLRSTINYELKDKNHRPYPTLFLSGANALIRREKLIALRSLDVRYSPYYMEDVDLSVRAWRKGWKCYYEPDAICYHKLSETISKHSSKARINYIAKRNKFLFHYTHLQGKKRILWQAKNILNLFTRWLILDLNYYKSYVEYNKLKKETTQEKYLKTLEEIVTEIHSAGKNLEKRLF